MRSRLYIINIPLGAESYTAEGGIWNTLNLSGITIDYFFASFFSLIPNSEINPRLVSFLLIATPFKCLRLQNATKNVYCGYESYIKYLAMYGLAVE